MLRNEVIQSNFQQLRRRKAANENRDLPLHVIAAESGLAVGTVHRISTGDVDGVRLSTIDALCAYFQVATISELVEFRSS